MSGMFNPSVNLFVKKLPNFSPYLKIINIAVTRQSNVTPKLTEIPIRETPPLTTIPLAIPKVNITIISERIVAPTIILPSSIFLPYSAEN
ncbi:hypothetical protein B188_17030 [Candidatus Brocadiaceae bacterium B188]|nr:hypothetical protein B188_17030 [Candidatus Brocadiaceae bacterium B188]